MIKELIPLRFGDGTMSAVDFRSDVRRVPDRAGERSVVVFDGEFPLFAWSGRSSEGGPALAERRRDQARASRGRPVTCRHVRGPVRPGGRAVRAAPGTGRRVRLAPRTREGAGT
ncbi:hypothetical protein ACFYWP_41430 [Actinacidiphila glaucinigra]|uniref:cyanase n=1 Tax=Actinacidiphila glaucinigra TaxID=235986 RepID=UPI0036B6AD25